MRPSSRRPDSMTGRRGDLCCARTTLGTAWPAQSQPAEPQDTLQGGRSGDCCALMIRVTIRSPLQSTTSWPLASCFARAMALASVSQMKVRKLMTWSSSPTTQAIYSATAPHSSFADGASLKPNAKKVLSGPVPSRSQFSSSDRRSTEENPPRRDRRAPRASPAGASPRQAGE